MRIKMTENMIEIKQADRNNFCETSMDSFDRFQEVQNVWRMENGRLVLIFHPFTETWSPEQRRKKARDILSGRFITFCAFEADAVVGEIMLIPELNENRLIIDSFMFPARSDGVGSDGVWLKLLLIMQEAAGLLPCTHPAVLLRKPLVFTRQWASA